MIFYFLKTFNNAVTSNQTFNQTFKRKMSASNKPFAELSKKEQELVGTIANRNTTLKKVSANFEAAQAYIIKTAKTEEDLWEFYNSLEGKKWIQCESATIGVYTHIDDYENKKGNISKAHFTENGKYYKSVNKITGKEPMSYKGYFEITEERFSIDFAETKKKGEFVFVPKPLAPRLAAAIKTKQLSGIIAQRKSSESSRASSASSDTSLDDSEEEEEEEEE